MNGREDSGEEARAVPERTAVWAWVEDDLEVLGIAAELAQELGGQVRAVTGTGDPEQLAALGADRVYVVEGLDEYDGERWVTALTGCLGQERPAAGGAERDAKYDSAMRTMSSNSSPRSVVRQSRYSAGI